MRKKVYLHIRVDHFGVMMNLTLCYCVRTVECLCKVRKLLSLGHVRVIAKQGYISITLVVIILLSTVRTMKRASCCFRISATPECKPSKGILSFSMQSCPLRVETLLNKSESKFARKKSQVHALVIRLYVDGRPFQLRRFLI